MSEAAGQQGVAELVVQALSEGAGDRDAYAFAVAGERLGASWLASADWDSLRCGFEVPVGDLAAATDLLADAVRRPRLEAATLARLRDERLDEIRVEYSQPASRAMIAFADAVFSDSSRYAVPEGGNLASVTAITDADVAAFHAGRLGPSTATLIVVGDLTEVDVEDLGRRVFDGWIAEPTPVPAPVVAAGASGRRLLIVDRPGSVQSILVCGHPGPRRDIPDYVAMTTMAMVLGGMFTSRLNLKLREEKGYAYGAFGGFDTRRDGGVFVARAAVQSEVTVPALADLVHEIVRTHDQGVEVCRARAGPLLPGRRLPDQLRGHGLGRVGFRRSRDPWLPGRPLRPTARQHPRGDEAGARPGCRDPGWPRTTCSPWSWATPRSSRRSCRMRGSARSRSCPTRTEHPPRRRGARGPGRLCRGARRHRAIGRRRRIGHRAQRGPGRLAARPELVRCRRDADLERADGSRVGRLADRQGWRVPPPGASPVQLTVLGREPRAASRHRLQHPGSAPGPGRGCVTSTCTASTPLTSAPSARRCRRQVSAPSPARRSPDRCWSAATGPSVPPLAAPASRVAAVVDTSLYRAAVRPVRRAGRRRRVPPTRRCDGR